MTPTTTPHHTGTALGILAAALLLASMFFGAHGTTAPERECSKCGRWGHWWGSKCPHCGQ